MVSNGERVSSLEIIDPWFYFIIGLTVADKKSGADNLLDMQMSARLSIRANVVYQSEHNYYGEYIPVGLIASRLSEFALRMNPELNPRLLCDSIIQSLSELLCLLYFADNIMISQMRYETLLERLISIIDQDFMESMQQEKIQYANFEQLVDLFIQHLQKGNFSPEECEWTRRALLQLRLLEPR